MNNYLKRALLLSFFTVTSFSVAAKNDNTLTKESNIKIKSKITETKKQDNDNFVKRMLPKTTYVRVGKPTVFIPKGQWIIGATVQYNEHDLDNIKFMVLDKVNLTGYNVKTSAHVGYALFNDGVLGLRASYGRSLFDLPNLDLNLGADLNLNISNYYAINHTISTNVFLRNYISVFNSLRFGLFNDVQVGYSYGQGKLHSGTGDNFSGTYNESHVFSVGLAPGGTVFLTDFTAIEISVGVLGFESTWITQTTNQVEVSKLRRSAANFKVDIFSFKLGLTFYLNTKKLKSHYNI